ncbi:MAG TPA: hypothetical protein VK668_16265 [Mucilaginibacter sp.]|nr:hypothetical protein [Mucilaginibacter sp.]
MTNILLLQANTILPTSSDPLDSLIAAAILLFILSTITEKFTELVRMYPGQFRIAGVLFCSFFYFQIGFGIFNEPLLGVITGIVLFVFNTFLLLVIIGNTSNSENATNPIQKFLNRNLSVFKNVKKTAVRVPTETKEREITALSYMIGLIVAFLFNANLFFFFDTSIPAGLKPSSPFAKDPYPLYALDPAFFKISIVSIVGFMLTAFFLSFGAKFFHDLLDNLLQVKNLKRKANEMADVDFNNISEFDQFLVTQEKNLFENFLKQQLNQPGVFFEGDLDNKSVTVHISDPKVSVPDKLFYKTSMGKLKEISVIKKVSLAIKTLSIPLFPSSEIANQSSFQNKLKGTFGYYVKAINSANIYLLTCYHVIWNGHDWDHFRPIGKENVVHPFAGNKIGEIFVALRNIFVDAVLIKPIDVAIETHIEGLGVITKDRTLDASDINRTVKMRGSISGNKEGFIAELNKSAFIDYPDGLFKQLDNLILIKTITGQPFSVGGDSGSLVVDDSGFAIGMIVAGNEKDLSLAIPFSALRDQLNIEIYKTL